MHVKLVMFTQEGERRDFDLADKHAIIGRSTETAFQIPLAEISRKHCELMIKDDRVVVRDLGSVNGTYVNNRRIQEVEVHVGDTLTVGPVIFTVVIDGRPTDIKPIRTVLEPKKAAKAKADADASGSAVAMGMEGSGTLDMLPEKDEDAENPLAELEELAKQRKS